MEKTFIKLDGKDYEYGSTSHIEKLESTHNVALAAAHKANTDLQSNFDTLQGTFDAAKLDFEKGKKSLEDLKKEDAEKGKKAIRARTRLILKALRLFGDDEDEEEEDEKKKADSLDAKFDALDQLSDREIMLKVVNGHEDYKEEKFDERSDEYVTAIFDSVVRKFKRADGVDSVVEGHRRSVKMDAADANNPVTKAQTDKAKRDNERWKKPLLVTKAG